MNPGPRHFFHTSAFILLTFCLTAMGATPPKEALLIANGKYSHFAGLAHPGPDAAKLGAALEGLGFRVRVVRNGNREQMLDAISEFERGLRNTGAIAFFHYGGHGVQVDGKNYLLPADADIPDERRVATRAVALDEVMTAMDAASARASIIVIDACRDNPLPAGSGRNLTRGLSVVGIKPKNSIVIYAAEAGSKALDGLFTPILASSLQQKGRSINQIMMTVRSEVYAKSSGQQTPGEYNQLFEELFLGEPASGDLSAEKIFAYTPTPTPYAPPTPEPLIKDDMVLVEGGTLPDASELAGKTVKTFYIGRTEVTWLEWKKARNWATDHGYDLGDVGNGSGNDHPVRNVSWYDCVKWCNARSEMAGLEPVYEVKGKVYRTGEYGYEGASVVTQNTSANGYRLPTKAEWEWAARGGVKSRGFQYSGSDDLSEVGWFRGNSKGSKEDLGSQFMKEFPDSYKSTTTEQKQILVGCGTWPVGQKRGNELGIHDMSGNVLEWCWDLIGPFRPEGGGSESSLSPPGESDLFLRPICGGSWESSAGACFVSYRCFSTSDYRNSTRSLRLARSAGP
jgi:formylglycine-generating enzyme required for sulfatase activity